MEEPQILCMSIPYARGWKAYVDGKEKEIYKCNVMYMGILMPEGGHDIELKYDTPGLKIGMLFSVVGMGIWMIIIARERRNKQ